MLTVSFTPDKAVFIDSKTNKAEFQDIFEPLAIAESIRTLKREGDGKKHASAAAISLLNQILDNPRIDGYRGKTPFYQEIPKELKAAIRDLEDAFLRTPFFEEAQARITGWVELGAAKQSEHIGRIEAEFQEFKGHLKAAGSYSNAKTHVVRYFAHCGKLPRLDTGKLLSQTAIERMVQIEKDKVIPPNDPGIAGKLESIAKALEDFDPYKTEQSTKLGNFDKAWDALQSIVDKFQQIQDARAMSTYEETTSGDVSKLAGQVLDDAIKAAMKEPEPALV